MIAPLPVGSTAESPWIQLSPRRQEEVKKPVQIPIYFLPHNQLSAFLTCYDISCWEGRLLLSVCVAEDTQELPSK